MMGLIKLKKLLKNCEITCCDFNKLVSKFQNESRWFKT